VLGTLCDTIYGLDAFALALPVAALAALVVAMRANPGGLSSARSA
jgi:hypothetical protein